MIPMVHGAVGMMVLPEGLAHVKTPKLRWAARQMKHPRSGNRARAVSALVGRVISDVKSGTPVPWFVTLEPRLQGDSSGV
jgi:hypothetical protein